MLWSTLWQLLITFLCFRTSANAFDHAPPAAKNIIAAGGLNIPAWPLQGIILLAVLALLSVIILIMNHFRRQTVEFEKKLRNLTHELKIAREHETFMNDITKHFNDYLFYHDMDGNIQDYDPARQRESDYTKNDIRRMNIRDLVPDQYKPEVSGYLERIRQNGSDSGYLNVVNRRGDHVILEYMSSVVYNAKGDPVGVRGISRDVTERVEAVKALRESEQKYRNILETIDDGYYEVDLVGNYIFFNTPMCRMLGYDCEALYGKNYADIVHEDYRRAVYQQFNYVFRTGKPIRAFDFKWIRKDGTVYFLDVSISLRRDENDNPIGFQGIARDVTKRIKTREKQKELEEQLQQSQKMESIGTLAGGIAHDFNNILFPIVGYTDLAMKGVPVCSKTYENLEKVMNSANRARELVEQILNFSRRSVEKDAAPVMIQPAVKENIKLLQTTVPANIAITSDIAGETGKVLITQSHIHQVVMNLCTNAYQAMDAARSGLIHVCLKQVEVADGSCPAYDRVSPDPYLLFSVSDNGCGIDPELTEKIFEPYFSTKTREKGTGLGLSVTYGIVKNAGGTIIVNSEVGSGTRFDVYLPVTHESNGVIEKGMYSILDPPGDERVLLVDDEHRIVELQQQVIESLGYHVTATASSTEALEIFTSRPDQIDLVLTDQAMPEMAGIELVEKLRRVRPDIPVILCTGYNDTHTREKALDLEINCMLQKPLTRNELALAMRKVLDNTG